MNAVVMSNMIKKELNYNLRPFARSLTRNRHEYYMTVRLQHCHVALESAPV